MNYKRYVDISSDIRDNLHLLKKEKFDLVVGIPRSGMIPAYMIALSLNLNCTTVQAYIKNDKLLHGDTRKVSNPMEYPWEATKVLVVDDSISTGRSLNKLKQTFPPELLKKSTFLAIYSSKPNHSEIDIALQYVSNPRVFEWNIFHHPMLGDSYMEMEGILCQVPTEDQKSTDNRYLEYIRTANTYIVPNHRIKTIITCRKEKYRAETEEWLRINGIKYEQLIMSPSSGKDKSIRSKSSYKIKVKYYKEADAGIFFESDPEEAKQICKVTSKPVYCVGNNRMYTPGILDQVLYDHKFFPKHYMDFKIRYKLFIKMLTSKLAG
ncbi:phosphoribosyltransferase family protein [Anditalea andensis]|uniref:Phosphoribosyltransferase domain-containing protein n=1 Tax=Anditalea andensis TaxID=1048983 RepID=A0A074LEF7_9BACT|nr:phosphoribosyltransferase family protein [Anditalea andensis]KEO72152.1 hypothetical protein EL17_19790 [Anditalea andensis]